MTKASKARMLAFLAKHLDELDILMVLNLHDADALKSLQEQYEKTAKHLAIIRDTPTTD
jgi:4-alpha-glucanotransferase